MEPTATEIAKSWRNMIERRSNMLATDVNVLERHFISAITAAEARAEARGRTQALEEAAELLCGYCSQGNDVTLTTSMEYDHFGAPYWPGWLHISTVGGKRFISQCGANLIRSAIESRTGEGEADSADSGEEEKQSGDNAASIGS